MRTSCQNGKADTATTKAVPFNRTLPILTTIAKAGWEYIGNLCMYCTYVLFRSGAAKQVSNFASPFCDERSIGPARVAFLWCLGVRTVLFPVPDASHEGGFNANFMQGRNIRTSLRFLRNTIVEATPPTPHTFDQRINSLARIN